MKTKRLYAAMLAGAEAYEEEHPDLVKLSIKGPPGQTYYGGFLDEEVQYANATANLAVTCMEGIMNKFPDGVAIICSNNDDMALAAARAAADNPAYANTIFLGFDGQKSAVEAVLNGELTRTAA